MKSKTTMNLASKSRQANRRRYQYTGNLMEIIMLGIKTNEIMIYLYYLPNYIQFLIKILIKVCDILIYYQNTCYFVHRDLHAKNIMIHN